MLLSLCSILLLLAGLLGWWVIYLHRLQREPSAAELSRQFEEQFEPFDEKLGVWKHRAKKGFFCPNCKSKNRVSQMIVGSQTIACPIQDCKFAIVNPNVFWRQGEQKQKEWP